LFKKSKNKGAIFENLQGLFSTGYFPEGRKEDISLNSKNFG
jgi:hypothetical protein